jgi:hypothetical protein
LKQAGSVPKEGKNECDGKTTNLVVAKKKGGNRLTSIIFYECPPYGQSRWEEGQQRLMLVVVCVFFLLW